MSTNSPAVSKRPSMSRRLRPLSITCVSPRSRGFGSRAGRSRKPLPLEPRIQLLQLLASACLDVAVHRAAVRVDADGERAEVLDPELPQALGHQLLPRHLLDLLDLRGLERRGAADDREIDHSEVLHGFDGDRKSTRLNSSHANISYAVFCLKKKKKKKKSHYIKKKKKKQNTTQI